MPTGIAEAIRLSWNNARLVALILNALTGILQFCEEQQLADVDSLFAMRMAQNALGQMDVEFKGNGLNAAIFNEVRNLSAWSDKLVNEGQSRLRKQAPETAKQVGNRFGSIQGSGGVSAGQVSFRSSTISAVGRKMALGGQDRLGFRSHALVAAAR